MNVNDQSCIKYIVRYVETLEFMSEINDLYHNGKPTR